MMDEFNAALERIRAGEASGEDVNLVTETINGRSKTMWLCAFFAAPVFVLAIFVGGLGGSLASIFMLLALAPIYARAIWPAMRATKAYRQGIKVMKARQN